MRKELKEKFAQFRMEFCMDEDDQDEMMIR